MVWKVDIIEAERGYGMRIDQTKTFETKQEADEFVKKYNADNTEKYAPDWYMAALAPKEVK